MVVGTYSCDNVLIFQILPTLKNKPSTRTIPLATIIPSLLTPSPQPPIPSPTHAFRYLQVQLLHLLCGEGFGGEDVVEVDLGIWIQDGDVFGEDRVFGWGEGARRGVVRVRNSV
jgi:hypothetical protein